MGPGVAIDERLPGDLDPGHAGIGGEVGVLEPGNGGRILGLWVGVTLCVVGHALAGPRCRPYRHPILGVGLQAGQLGLVGHSVADARLSLQQRPQVGALHLGVVYSVAGQHAVDLLRRLPVEQQGRRAHGVAVEHVDGARLALRRDNANDVRGRPVVGPVESEHPRVVYRIGLEAAHQRLRRIAAHDDLAELLLSGRVCPGLDLVALEVAVDRLRVDGVPGDEGTARPYYLAQRKVGGRLTRLCLTTVPDDLLGSHIGLAPLVVGHYLDTVLGECGLVRNEQLLQPPVGDILDLPLGGLLAAPVDAVFEFWRVVLNLGHAL